MESRFTAFAPASLSNLGPGFDCLGLALGHWHDKVVVELIDEPEYHVSFDPSGEWTGPTEPSRNTASVAAIHVAERVSYRGGARISIRKGIRAGSGLGSSAASAVAGAMAMNLALDSPFSKADLIPSCLAGESVVSGAMHGDNVLPSLLGGIVLVESGSPDVYERIEAPSPFHFAVILPDVEVLTQEARSLLPEQITLEMGSIWASRLAQLVNAFQLGDAARVGGLIMKDEIVEPIRARLLKPYQDIKLTALRSGALGCALSGSGPAMFAVCSSPESASSIAQVMQDACGQFGIESRIVTETVNSTGAYTR